MSAQDFDVEAIDRRAHDLAKLTAACRYALAAFTLLCLTSAWSCRDGGASAKAASYDQGVADECRRWTP